MKNRRTKSEATEIQESLFPISKSSSASQVAVGQESRSRVVGARRESKPIGKFQLNQVHQLDCLVAMLEIPDSSVDVAIADPPYNLSKGNKWQWDNSVKLPGFGGDWQKVMAGWDDMPLADYFSFSVAWLSQLKRIVRPTGSIWIHGTYHNIGIINFALQALQIEIVNEVIWYKRNSFPNLSGRRLTASHETILWAHTGSERKRKYMFNYARSKAIGSSEDRLKQPGKQMRTVWDIPNNKERKELELGKHPTQKPLRLLRRMLEVSAAPGQVLLAPFSGSGAECVAGVEKGMFVIGFETDKAYVDLANQRIAATLECSGEQESP